MTSRPLLATALSLVGVVLLPLLVVGEMVGVIHSALWGNGAGR